MTDAWRFPIAALAQHSAFIGKTGSGKSFAARGCVEQLLEAKKRVCIIDPTGVWYGLKSSADGKAEGFPVVVFGGDHADVALTEKMAEALGELVALSDFSSVIDLTGFGVGEMRRFMAAFAGALYHHMRAPIHLVIDEADEFAPQRIPPDATLMFNRIDRIVRRGRSRGFVVTMISQRPAVLNKDVLSQAATLVAMKLTGPHDRDALGTWIDGQASREEGKEVIASLPRLKLGEGWVWWPDGELLKRVRFPMIRTFDSMRAPGHGEQRAEPQKLAHVDLAGIKGKLAIVEQAPQSKTPGKQAGGPTVDVEAIRSDAFWKGEQKGRAISAKEIGEALAFLRIVRADIWKGIDGAIAALEGGQPKVGPIVRPLTPNVIQPGNGARTPPTAKGDRFYRQPSSGQFHLLGAGSGLLAALVSVAPAGLTWSAAATIAGLKARGGHFNSGRRSLADHALVEERGGMVFASAAGISQVGADMPEPKTPAQTFEMWVDRLPNPAPDMLKAVRDFNPTPVDKVTLGEAIHLKPLGGHWNRGIAILRDNGLIVSRGDGWTLSPLLGGPS